MSHACATEPSATGVSTGARPGGASSTDVDPLLLEVAPDATLVEPGEEPPRRFRPGIAAGPTHREHELLPGTADAHRRQHPRSLRELARLLGADPERDRLPVAREPPLERTPLIPELHGGQHNDARDPGLRPGASGCAGASRVRRPETLMATDVKLPRLGQGMESGVIVRWLKSEGDAVSSGEPLYELDTDKVTQEVEADVAGTLLKIVVTEGEVAVGSTVAVIGEDGEAADSAGDESTRSAATVEPGAEQSADADADGVRAEALSRRSGDCARGVGSRGRPGRCGRAADRHF